MLREYCSYDDLNASCRVLEGQSLDSQQDRIRMNPNGRAITSVSADALDDCYTITCSQSHSGLLREHNFKVKAYYYNGGHCVQCKKRIRFGMASLRCRSCPLRCHISCSRHLTVNCIPQSLVTTKRGYLSDYAPAVAPMVPALIVHCVTEIELRGLHQEGIYRKSSTREKCRKLRQKLLRGKSTPHLGDKDIHLLCCCIKEFLRRLIEPLIPIYHRKKFEKAAQMSDPLAVEESVYLAVQQLQAAHRDTLAYLMLHWQRVAQSPSTRMNVNNLSMIFAPNIFGEMDINLTNVVIRQHVVKVLLQLPPDFWAHFLEVGPTSPLEYVDRQWGSSANLRWQTVKTYFRSMVNLTSQH